MTGSVKRTHLGAEPQTISIGKAQAHHQQIEMLLRQAQQCVLGIYLMDQLLLASERLAKTTGQILSVDGGLHEAFLR